MKLPENPKERLKVLVLIGIGAAFLALVLVTLVIRPLVARKKATMAEIAEVREKLETAQRDVARMLQDRDRNAKVLGEIVSNAREHSYVLQPRLGNYELGAREYVESIAQGIGLKLGSVQEVGITQLPQPASPQSERQIKCYNLRISFATGLHELVQFLQLLESGNPYICVSSLAINARSEDNSSHEIALDLQWPVWSSPEMQHALEQRLEEARRVPPTGNESPAPGGVP